MSPAPPSMSLLELVSYCEAPLTHTSKDVIRESSRSPAGAPHPVPSTLHALCQMTLTPCSAPAHTSTVALPWRDVWAAAHIPT